MATGAIKAIGTLLKIGDGGGVEVFTTIAEVKDISGPSFELETADATSHSSTNGWREFVGTAFNGGEVSFSINFIPTENTHDYGAGILKDMVNRTLRNFKLVFPDSGSTTWTFAALVTKFEPSMALDDVLSAEITLKLSGYPTLA